MTGAILNWVRATWDAVRTSLWLVPGVMFALGAVLAFVMLGIDEPSTTGGSAWREWIGAGSGEDARNLLSTLLTSVIAMASIVFSVTVLSRSPPILTARAWSGHSERTAAPSSCSACSS